MSELRRFRSINKLEGYSYLFLLFIAMPLKYLAHYPVATKIAGMIHGILFLYFVYQLFEAKKEAGFTRKETLTYFIFSLIPFGSFYTDALLKRRYRPLLHTSTR